MKAAMEFYFVMVVTNFISHMVQMKAFEGY